MNHLPLSTTDRGICVCSASSALQLQGLGTQQRRLQTRCLQHSEASASTRYCCKAGTSRTPMLWLDSISKSW